MSREKDVSEMDDGNYLLDLADRLMHVPIVYGTDQYDVDRLSDIAVKLKAQR